MGINTLKVDIKKKSDERTVLETTIKEKEKELSKASGVVKKLAGIFQSFQTTADDIAKKNNTEHEQSLNELNARLHNLKIMIDDLKTDLKTKEEKYKKQMATN